MSSAVELISKIVGVLAAILGLAGYVLVLGAAILWLRLHQADLPPTVPVSLAAHDELIAIGAQAVAVWVALLAVLGGLAAWIATGDPSQRRFGYTDAGLALSVTLATLFALDSQASWLVVLPGVAAVLAAGIAIYIWPSPDAVAAVLLPLVFAVALGIALSFLGTGNEVATSTGAIVIFGILVLITPALQRWRASQGANRAALPLVQARVDDEPGLAPLAVALEQRSTDRPTSVVWVERVAITLFLLLVLGIVAVTSQVDRHKDFHKALVSLTNGDCVEGTYLTRNNEQLVIAQPGLASDAHQARIAVIPVKEILEVQVYGQSLEGVALAKNAKCTGNEDVLVRPSPSKSGSS